MLNALLHAKGFSLLEHHAIPTHESRSLPKIVWMFWEQGEANAPPIVQYCIRSWRDLNPTWDVRVVDGASLTNHLDMQQNSVTAKLPVEKRANVIRNKLLVRHGGVWADATTLCAIPLDKWLYMLMPSGFFFFSRPGPDRLISNWFIASDPRGEVMTSIDRAYDAYWERKHGPYPYFGYHYTIEYLYRTDRRFRKKFMTMPRIPAEPSHWLQRWITSRNRSTKPIPDLHGIPIHKLTHKKPIDVNELLSITDTDTDTETERRSGITQ